MSALAKKLYERYKTFTGGISLVTKTPIPEWDGLRYDIQLAWEAVAGEVEYIAANSVKMVFNEAVVGKDLVNELSEMFKQLMESGK